MPANEFNAKMVELLNDLLTMDQEIASSLVWAARVDDLSEEALANADKALNDANGLMSIVEKLCGSGAIEIELQADGQVAAFKLSGAESDESGSDDKTEKEDAEETAEAD